MDESRNFPGVTAVQKLANDVADSRGQNVFATLPSEHARRSLLRKEEQYLLFVLNLVLRGPRRV